LDILYEHLPVTPSYNFFQKVKGYVVRLTRAREDDNNEDREYGYLSRRLYREMAFTSDRDQLENRLCGDINRKATEGTSALQRIFLNYFKKMDKGIRVKGFGVRLAISQFRRGPPATVSSSWLNSNLLEPPSEDVKSVWGM
jgi:hypothetical protein